MKVIRKDSVYFFDVDDTLVFDAEPTDVDAIKMNYYGMSVWKKAHKEHVKLIHASVARGRQVIINTGNGYAWGEEVMKKLKLDHLPLLVISKSAGYCDDVPVEKWFGSRVWIPFNKKRNIFQIYIDKISELCYNVNIMRKGQP